MIPEVTSKYVTVASIGPVFKMVVSHVHYYVGDGSNQPTRFNTGHHVQYDDVDGLLTCIIP